MARALVPLDVIASNVCADLGDSIGKHKFKITRHLLSAYRDLHLFVDTAVDVKTQVMACSNIIKMPNDFVYQTKVGVMNNGRIAILTLDDSVKSPKLTDSQTCEYMEDVWGGTYSGESYTFYNAYEGDIGLGELYGSGRGVSSNGTYTFDKAEGVIYIGGLIPQCAKLVVEYKSDGVTGGLKLVPVEMEKALEYYAKAEWYADRNITQSQINRNKYELAYNKVKRLYNFKSSLYMANKINSMFSSTNY